MIAYRYDGGFAGFLTCVWDALENRIDPVAFLLPEDGATLWEEREVAADENKARRLYAALARRVSGRFRHFITWGFLTCLPERELALFTLIRRGMRSGPRVAMDLSDPVMARVMLAYQKLATEQDHLKGFVRFSELDGALVGEIEPKNRVLPLLASHFAARYSGERLVLYDRTHHEVLVSDRGQWKLLSAEDFRMGPAGAELTPPAAAPEELLRPQPMPITVSGPRLLAWLRPGEEPTAHFLNELAALDVPFPIPVETRTDAPPTDLPRVLGLDPESLPLLALVGWDGLCHYAGGGYWVGSAALLARLAALLV